MSSSPKRPLHTEEEDTENKIQRISESDDDVIHHITIGLYGKRESGKTTMADLMRKAHTNPRWTCAEFPYSTPLKKFVFEQCERQDPKEICDFMGNEIKKVIVSKKKE